MEVELQRWPNGHRIYPGCKMPKLAPAGVRCSQSPPLFGFCHSRCGHTWRAFQLPNVARDYAIGVDAWQINSLADSERATFQGYKHAGGKVGTRNYLGILTSVNCSPSAARFIAQAVQTEEFRERYPNIGGVVVARAAPPTWPVSTSCPGVLPHEEMFPQRWLSPHLGCCRTPTGPGLQRWCFPWATACRRGGWRDRGDSN